MTTSLTLVRVFDRTWAAWLRKQFQQPRAVAASGDDLARDLARDLADYDRAFGLHDQFSDEDGVS